MAETVPEYRFVKLRFGGSYPDLVINFSGSQLPIWAASAWVVLSGVHVLSGALT